MSRSISKGIYINDNIKKLLLNDQIIHIQEISTRDRSSTIIPQLLGKKVIVYNGKEYHSLIINSDMIGHKLGEFVGTRKRAIYKKKTNKKK